MVNEETPISELPEVKEDTIRPTKNKTSLVRWISIIVGIIAIIITIVLGVYTDFPVGYLIISGIVIVIVVCIFIFSSTIINYFTSSKMKGLPLTEKQAQK